MKRVVLWVCALMMTLMASVCVAGTYSPYFTTEPPREVREHVASRWPDYEFEDYCEVRGTPKGDYGFALVHRKSERILVGYHKVDGEMKYWLKNAGAVPQGKEEALFTISMAERKDEFDRDGRPTGKVYDDGLWFSVTRLDASGESYEKGVCYSWENGGFRLTNYGKATLTDVMVTDDGLDFSESGNGTYGYVQGTVQRDIRYVSFNTLPAWIDDAKEKLTVAPNLRSGDFTSQKVKFTGGQKFPVYTGPGTNYARSGNGKGLVSTNGWIEVYGQKDGWILIQYSISSDHYRFGWIEKSALPKGTTVPELNFRVAPGDQSVAFNRDSYLTDDPLVSRAKLCTVKAETDIFYLGSLNDEWAYVMVETADGRWMCGFMPHEDISNG